MLICLDGPGLRMPWQTDSTKDIFENLTNQQRNDITQEAQVNITEKDTTDYGLILI